MTRPDTTPARLALTVAVAALAAPLASAQQGPAPASPAAAPAQVPPPSPPPSPDAIVATPAQERWPALREGGYLLEVHGVLRRDADGGWLFRVEQQPGSDPALAYELRVLPCALLAYMQ